MRLDYYHTVSHQEFFSLDKLVPSLCRPGNPRHPVITLISQYLFEV